MYLDARGALFGIQGYAGAHGQPFTGSVYMVTVIAP
jgi:hypothetical protein